eukprot:3129406-Ditylum_brightwellii.AAC.1
MFVDLESFTKLADAKISLNEAHDLQLKPLGKDKKESRIIIRKILGIDPANEAPKNQTEQTNKTSSGNSQRNGGNKSDNKEGVVEETNPGKGTDEK